MARPGPLPTVPPAPEGAAVRPATPADRPALARLLTEAFDDATWDEERVDRELLANADVPRTWVVASADEATSSLLATASELVLPGKYGDAGCVHWVATGLAARGRGLGAVAVLACLTGFAERGLTSAVLNTDDGRPAAVRVYLQLGFVPVTRDDAETAAWSALLPTVLSGRSGSPA